MRNSVKRLFCDKDFREYKRSRLDDMKAEISDLSSNELSQNSTDSLALIFAAKYTPSHIQIYDVIKEDGGEVEKDISHRQDLAVFDRSTPTMVTFQRIRVKLPFDGDRSHMLAKPSTYNYSPPIYNELNHNEIVYFVDYRTQNRDPEEIAEEVEKEIENWREDVDWYIEQLNNDIRKMQTEFEGEARSAIERRRNQVETRSKVMDELGVDTGEVSNRGYVIPEKKRSIDIPTTGSEPSSPVLQDTTFLEILGIIDDLGLNIERSAEHVRSLDEESLRDIFLAGINSHFAGLATGETFNRTGKTDILLRHDNENLFVAECKFWEGQSQYTDAIDQLLQNLTVRDSHALLLIFSRRQGFEQVVDRIAETTRSHEKCETKLANHGGHEVYRFQIKSGTPVKVAVKAFDLQV